MKHLSILAHADPAEINGKSVQQRAAGRFYTHERIGRALAAEVADTVPHGLDAVSILDPFGGDGRLLVWLTEELAVRGFRKIEASVWDQEGDAVDVAVKALEATASKLDVEIEVDRWTGDTFERAITERRRWTLVITNPPWELLKPDHREMRRLPPDLRDEYIAELRAFDRRLSSEYPTSQPSRRFAGWGTNLSRVGTEVALRLTEHGGSCGVVCPSSLLADSTTGTLRRWLFQEFAVNAITHFPAEARLFQGVDVPCCTFVAVRGGAAAATSITRVAPDHSVVERTAVQLDHRWLDGRDFAVPVQMGVDGIRLLRLLDQHPRWAAFEGRGPAALWAGRELDETRRAEFTLPEGDVAFVRSLHIQRLVPPRLPPEFVDLSKRALPASTGFVRLAWRDISRPSQKRRVHATLLPAGCVTGNSLSVAYFRDQDHPRLLALLGIVSSLPFEFQVRSLLMTNHVSLSVMRASRVPALDDPAVVRELAEATFRCLQGESEAEEQLELAVARAYGLDAEAHAAIAAFFGFRSPMSALPAAVAA
ncbi:MAG: hypothetical protein WKF94_11925 [Solirubrobacteraceae bacterium]